MQDRVFELAQQEQMDKTRQRSKVRWMKRLSATIQRPVTFALLQGNSTITLETTPRGIARSNGTRKPMLPPGRRTTFGTPIGLQTHHAFAKDQPQHRPPTTQ